MEGISFGRTSLVCTLLLWTFQVCNGVVTVEVPPLFEVLMGETVTLTSKYTVTPLYSGLVLQWHTDVEGNRKRIAFRTLDGRSKVDMPMGGRYSMGEDFSLTISSAQPTDEVVYIFHVIAGRVGVEEGQTTLKVFRAPEKPELTRPSSQAISVGGTISSEIGTCVTKNGHPQPRIIWFKDGHPLPEVKDRKEKTYMIPSLVKEASGLYTVKSTLYMQPVKADKDSVFQCVVEYSMPGNQIKQNKSDTITLNLNYPSEIATFTLLNTDPVKEGDNVTMHCETDGNPQPEFDFFKNDILIKSQGGLVMLESVKRTDSAVYKCMGTDYDNIDADLGGTINLNVHYMDPVSVTPVEPQLVMLGDKVEWQCKTKASDAHTIQWKKGSEVLSQDGTLSIQQISYDNAGEYKCVGAVPSVPGLTAEASVNLAVKGKPMIETPAAGEVEKEGDTVSLKCSALGSPPPQFVWKPSGKESVSVEGIKVVNTVTLKATAEVIKDGVICTVSNELGTDSTTFPVSLKKADNSADRADKQQGGSSGVVIAVVVCVLLLLLLVALIYFLNKKSKLPCGKKANKEVAGGEINNDIVVEMKTEKANEGAGLLNKRPPTEQ